MRKGRKKRKIGTHRKIEWKIVNNLVIESCENNQNQVQMNNTCTIYLCLFSSPLLLSLFSLCFFSLLCLFCKLISMPLHTTLHCTSQHITTTRMQHKKFYACIARSLRKTREWNVRAMSQPAEPFSRAVKKPQMVLIPRNYFHNSISVRCCVCSASSYLCPFSHNTSLHFTTHHHNTRAMLEQCSCNCTIIAIILRAVENNH